MFQRHRFGGVFFVTRTLTLPYITQMKLRLYTEKGENKYVCV